jgi:hypothetical protein
MVPFSWGTSLGGTRPRLKKKEPVAGTKRELVIIARPAVTLDQVRNDPRKRNLLLVFSVLEKMKGIYERSLAFLLYWLKTEKGIDLGYDFLLVGDTPTSKQLREDLVSLLYVGLIESDPVTKKLRITNEGKEFLKTSGVDEQLQNKLEEAIEELKPKLTTIEAQLELTTMLMRPSGPRRRRPTI